MLRLALCQMNSCVGDLQANADSIVAWSTVAAEHGADLAVFPELALCGYPAEDLWLKRHFLERCREMLEEIAPRLALPSLIGFPELAEDVYNSCAVVVDGQVAGTYRKQFLPNYAVFDEHRYFREGNQPSLLQVGDTLVGLTICEDVWHASGPAHVEAAAGAQVIVNLSASPYRMGRGAQRERMLASRAADGLCFVALCNQVCGQDELVFDGNSVVVDHEGVVVARAAQFEPELLICDIDPARARDARLQDTRHREAGDGSAKLPVLATIPAGRALRDGALGPGDREPVGVRVNGCASPLEPEAEVWAALCLGLRDYVDKNGFASTIVGLSGGIDSALVVALACDALGARRVQAVTMPSRYSSEGTRGDAHRMARLLDIDLQEIPIEPVMESYGRSLAAAFAGRDADITEENLQARIRGNLLMALSNKFGHLVLTTGNKSEVSVGYMTLYGDMAGGFAPIKDVPKTLVYRLARWLNERERRAGRPEPIPTGIIERAPSAELREDQRDTDSLPPYDILDPLLERIVEHDRSLTDLVTEGFDPAVAERVMRLVDRSEYKRRQAPPGIRVTARAFGRDRRMPITNRFEDRLPAHSPRDGQRGTPAS